MFATRRHVIRSLLAMTASLAAAPARAETTRITFILVNDIYLMGDELLADGQRRGGFARLAAVVKAERAKGGHVIFAHAGDTLSPSLMSGLDHGEHIITLTNMVPPDIFTPGNHEFDFGKAVFFQRMSEAKFPVYAANLLGPDGGRLPNVKDRSILTFDGIRVGLTGLTFDESPRTSSPEDLRFLPTIASARTQAQELRREGADIVVAVAHADRGQDYAILATGEVDLLLSGHDHDLFISYDGRNAAVESTYDAHCVTAIDVSIAVTTQDGKRTMRWSPQFRVIDTATVTPDPEVAAAVAVFEEKLRQEMGVPFGSTAFELDSRNATVRLRESAMGNVIADAMRKSVDADVAIMNGGGIRGGRIYPAGTLLTRRDIRSELPFNNRLITIGVNGHDLRRAFENGLSLLPNAAGRFPQVSGVIIEADASRPAGDRVLTVTVAGKPLDESKTYRVATNDFMARGGDGYVMFRNTNPVAEDTEAPILATEVIAYIRNAGTLRTGVEGRIVFR
jgi:2',3'-cyclic-nucleotide 2'-phosphodiesterase (5'-nucleotidase family)